MNILAFISIGLTAILLAGCGSPTSHTLKAKPELRQFGTLKPDDFSRHPVWVQCHIIDYGEPWYEETDEETFRPWTGALPVDPKEAMFLVRATFNLADGTRFSGLVTPSQTQDLGSIQPALFSVGGQRVAFWFGMFPRAEEHATAYQTLGRTAEQVFPVRFSAETGLTRGVASGTLEGFYSITDGKVRIEE